MIQLKPFAASLACSVFIFAGTTLQAQTESPSTTSWLASGEFGWLASGPLLKVQPKTLPASPQHPWVSVKDPSIVRFQDQWHLFCSLRKKKTGDGRIRIGYTSFDDWANADQAKWRVLELTDGYHGAPQVFYFEPQQTWYLIYQAVDTSRDIPFGPCYSTNANLADPSGWTLPQPLYRVKEGAKAGLDFWVIADDESAHLFFTTLDGRMWRAETLLADFPNQGWSDPVVVLKADIFEASHTYKVRGANKYLTVIEAQGNGGRYYKAYLADSLRGQWNPLAATAQHAFASPDNVQFQSEPWSQSFSHGELIRLGFNEKMEIDPDRLQFVFQGASRSEYRTKDYGDIPWKLGILESPNSNPSRLDE